MILQALYDYYQRKPDLPREGFESKEVPFVIEVSKIGSVVQIEDTRSLDGKKKRAKNYLLPQAAKKSVNVAANMLWGNAEYVLGLPDEKKLADRKGKGKEGDYGDRLKDMHTAFVDAIKALPKGVQADEGVRAVLKFIDQTKPADLERFGEIWKEIRSTNPNMTFRLQGDLELVCQRPSVINALNEATSEKGGDGICLLTGQKVKIERLHPLIKGVWGAQTSGANVVSFNLPSFTSWGKEQGDNAPVGEKAAFAYTTALNYLLARDSRQRIQIGDASTVFWADKASSLEDQFADLFGEPPKDDPDRNARAIKSLYEAPKHGIAPIDDVQTRFFVLGLSPNAARIAIRFWHVGTVAELARNIQQHFDDLEIIHPEFEMPYLSVFRLLLASAVQGKSENIPPNLGGDVMRAILAGNPYPTILLQGVVRRIRAEQSKRDERTGKLMQNVTHARAALIKACLNRQGRSLKIAQKEVAVSLDFTNCNSGYRLGRLFAVLEKTQEEANPGINSTIRERFYGSASATPLTAFPILMKLKNHHIAKLENPGRKINLERLIGEIMEGVNDFPAHLSLADQGRFAVGYYHQRQAFFSKTTEIKQGE
ncbi:MAG: Type I-C CRISPR-associated protein Cas8c/Csd1 [Nitrospira sp.]|nr:MAG: Type I-C CRISPR-associated protein Cas8c/Csd1 [Nitrospira sp.]